MLRALLWLVFFPLSLFWRTPETQTQDTSITDFLTLADSLRKPQP